MGNIDKSLKDLFNRPKNTFKPRTLSVMESITPRSFLRWNRHPSGSASPILKNFNLKKFGGKNDWDGDGVPNKKDCQPRNTMRQDFTPFRRQEKAEDMTAARRFGGANLQRLKKIGSGRDRVIYALDKDMAFKKSTDTPISNYPDSFGYRGKVVYGTPDDFMLKTKKEHLRNLLNRGELKQYKKFENMSPEEYEDDIIHKSNLPHIKEGLQSKKPLVPIGWLETNRGKYVGHEGRHRAVAAKQLGIKTIPWIEVESDKGYIDEENIQSDIFEPNKNTTFIDNKWVVDSPEEIQSIVPAEEIEEEEDDDEKLRQEE